MPDLDSYIQNYRPFDGMLGTVALCKFISLLYKIVFEQSAQDIFMIDWESPKMYEHGRFEKKLSVNPWRRLYIVNEFNELQGSKHINTDMILLLFLVLTEGFGYKNWALMES